jgi:hypothetical protein
VLGGLSFCNPFVVLVLVHFIGVLLYLLLVGETTKLCSFHLVPPFEECSHHVLMRTLSSIFGNFMEQFLF